EVLRGPQGTLFGRNTVGGALNIISADPTGEFGGMMRVEAGSYDQMGASLVLNIPITERLSGRLVASTKDRDGYGKSIHLDRDVWGQSSTCFGGKRRYEDDRARVVLSGDYHKIEDNGQFTALLAYAPEVFGPTGAFGPF